MMSITVSAAGSADAEAMAGLLSEMDGFYGAVAAGSMAERVRGIREALFADPPAGYVLLARAGESLAGLASYSFLWPAVGLKRSVFLKELYVAAAYRRHGVGRLLMRALAEVAARHGCSRVEWTTGSDNHGAQAFYARLGLPACPSKIFYRVNTTGMATGGAELVR